MNEPTMHAGSDPSQPNPDSGLTSAQLETLRQRLIDKRRNLARDFEQHRDRGRFASERTPEPEEAAQLDTEQATMIDLAESERRILQEVDAALGRITEGTYGVSEESGEPIGYERLLAIPWARRSAADQEVIEREQKRSGR